MSFNAYIPPATSAQIAAIHSMIHVTPGMVRYDSAQIGIGLTFPLLDLALLAAMLHFRLAARVGHMLMQRTGQRLFLAGIVFWIALHAVTTLILLPLSYYSGFVPPSRFGLSGETNAAWLTDVLKGWAIDMLVGAPIASACLLLIRRAPKRWPVLAAALLIPVVAVGIFATPLVIDPLFNKFSPMAQSDPLYGRIEYMAHRAGIGSAQIFVVDKSKQTHETNAYVTGLGSSTRIVIWDTLIRKMPPAQVAAVTAHEMGHYAEHHVFIGFIASAAALFLLLPLTRALAEEMLKRWKIRWRLEALHQPAALAVLLLAFNLIVLVITPIASTASRYLEHRADAFGIALTGDRVTFARSLVALSADNLSNPYPPRWVVLLMDHPPLGERIDFALTGQPRDLWPKPGLPARSPAKRPG